MIVAPAPNSIDESALEHLCERLRLLMQRDPRRLIEFPPAYRTLEAAGAIFFSSELELAGAVVDYIAPHPRFVALYENLRLRSRLNLPTGEVAA